MPGNPPSPPPRSRTPAGLWFAIFGPPILWLLQFQVRYVLAGFGAMAARVAMTLIGAAALAAVGACAFPALRCWRKRNSSMPAHTTGHSAARFMSELGLLSAALFLLAIVAQLLAEFFIPPGAR